MSFWSCEDATDELYPDMPNTPENVDNELTLEVSNSYSQSVRQNINAFMFDIEKNSCTDKGYSLKVLIEKPFNYGYNWKVDGHSAGTSTQLHCVTGQKIQLIVTRYSDLLTISKFLELPPSDEESNATEDEMTN